MNDRLSKAYYSIIQYCPDAGKAEAANVGVLLFCPDQDFLEARVAHGNDRIRRFFGRNGVDLARLNIAKQSIVKRLAVDKGRFQTLQDLEQFVATRANEIRLVSSRPIKVADPSQDLDKLFAEFVGGRVRRPKHSPIFPELELALRSEDIRSRVMFSPPPVCVPIIGRSLKAPYAYRNGALNLIQPQVFGADEGSATKVAATLAIEADLLSKYSTSLGDARLIVIAGFESHESDRPRHIQALDEYNVRCVLRDDIASLVDEIRHHAH